MTWAAGEGIVTKHVAHPVNGERLRLCPTPTPPDPLILNRKMSAEQREGDFDLSLDWWSSSLLGGLGIVGCGQ